MPLYVGEHVLSGAGLRQRGTDPPAGKSVRRRGGFVGILPQSCKQTRFRPPPQSHPAVVEQKKHDPLLDPPGAVFGPYRQLLRPALQTGPAERRCGTAVAEGRAVGQAHQRPQLHQRLIEGPGHIPGDHLGQSLPVLPPQGRRADVRIVSGEPGQHPHDVAVHGGRRLSEGDGGDGPCGIFAHPGEGEQRVVVRGKDTAEIAADDLCGLLQVSGPVVVPQPLPQLQQRILLRLRQRQHVRQALHEAFIVLQHRRHTGLLEHDLRHQHVIGGGITAPGQGPGVLPVPQQQRQGQLRQRRHRTIPPLGLRT